MKERILAALRILGKANYKEIVSFLQVKNPKQVLKRLTDLCNENKITKTSERAATTKNKTSAIYIIINYPKTDTEAKKKNKIPFKRKIILRRSRSNIIQSELFQ